MERLSLQTTVGIGVVTFNRLDLLKVCLPSLLATGCPVAVWDNGSNPDVVEWLESKTLAKLFRSAANRGLPYGRNRLIEFFRDNYPKVKYILQPDSDVELLPDCLTDMVETAERFNLMLVAWPQANQRCVIREGMMVDDVANECLLSRMDLWSEIGLYPEIDALTGRTMMIYASDTWKLRVAAMHGYSVGLVCGRGDGYRHHQHGSLVRPESQAIITEDSATWMRKLFKMHNHWIPDPSALNDRPYQPRESYSQYGEDRFIADFFGNDVGCFLDIGAHDGAHDSNTLRLAELGWPGVCVEPHPVLFARMLMNHAAFPKLEHLLGLVMGDRAIRTLHLNMDGLSTTHPAVFETLHRRVNYNGYCHTTAVTPDDLAVFYDRTFDFVSIDAEGCDMEIVQTSGELLAGTKLLCIEKDRPGCEPDAETEDRWKAVLGVAGFVNEVHRTKGNVLLTR